MRLVLGFLIGVTLNAGTLLVLNKEDATLVFVDTATRTVSAPIPVGQGTHEIVTSTDGKLAFVTNYGTGNQPGSTISVIDIPARKELRRFDTTPLGRPHGIDFYSGKAYFTSESSKIIARYDPATNKTDWLLGTGQTTTHMVTVGTNGKQFYTANIGGNTISIIENAPGYAQTVVPVGKGPEGFDISPDGRQLWAANSQDGTISVIDLTTKQVTATVDVGTKRSNRLKFTPDAKTVLITDLTAGDLIFLDVATRKVTKRLQVGKAPEGIIIIGKTAYIAVNGDDFIQLIDLATQTATTRIQTGKGPDGMAYLP